MYLYSRPEQLCSKALWHQEEHQKATLLHFAHHGKQVLPRVPEPPLHGDQPSRPHQLKQPHGRSAHQRAVRAVLQRPFSGKPLSPEDTAQPGRKLLSSVCSLTEKYCPLRTSEGCSFPGTQSLHFVEGEMEKGKVTWVYYLVSFKGEIRTYKMS